MTTAEIESMKDERICLVSSLMRELAKEMEEQKRANHALHLSFIMSPHILNNIDNTFM